MIILSLNVFRALRKGKQSRAKGPEGLFGDFYLGQAKDAEERQLGWQGGHLSGHWASGRTSLGESLADC